MRTLSPLPILAVLLLGAPAAPAGSGIELHYAFLTMGKREGGLILRGEGLQLTVEYEFNDRGRGPKLHEQILLDEAGLPVRYRVSGRAYMGGEVDEQYALSDGRARWRSPADSGERRDAAGHLYVPADGTPAATALAARALLQASARRLPALPAGELALRELHEVELGSGERTVRVHLYAIDGMDLTPTYVWLDEAGWLFAAGLGWSSLIAEGWESEADRLAALQRAADAEHLAGLRERLSRQPTGPVAIRGGRMFDSLTGRTLESATVVVYGARIGAVYEGAVDVPGAETIDAAGLTLLPGLFDMHDHIGGWSNLLQIAGGVTSVRDLASNNEQFLELLARQARGELIGPRVFAAGFIDQQGPYSGPAGILAGSLEEALAGVEWYAQHAYRQIKLYSSIDPAWVAPLAAAAHARQMRLSGHIPAFMTAEQAVRAGYDEIQHINMLFLNFVAPGEDTRTPLRFLAVAERAGSLDLDSREVQRFIALLVEREIVVDPTVTIFEDMFLNRSGEPSPAYAMVYDRLPVALQRALLGETLDIGEHNATTYRQSFEALLDLIGRLHQAGVRLVAGTDALSGFTLHRELEHYVAAGVPPARVLQIATIDAARLVEADQWLGSITPGKRADLILIDGDPARDISDIRRIVWVMKDGVSHDPAELYRVVGIRPHPDARRTGATGGR